MNTKYRFRVDSSKPGHTIGLQTFCHSASRIPEIITQHQIELPDCVSTVAEMDQTPAVNAHDSLVAALKLVIKREYKIEASDYATIEAALAQAEGKR